MGDELRCGHDMEQIVFELARQERADAEKREGRKEALYERSTRKRASS